MEHGFCSPIFVWHLCGKVSFQMKGEKKCHMKMDIWRLKPDMDQWGISRSKESWLEMEDMVILKLAKLSGSAKL